MTKEETDLIIAEQNKSTEEILKAVAKVKADYHELCKLKDMRIAELEHQLTHRNCLDCSNHSSKLRMRTLELEKENAELKRQLEMSNKVYNDNLDYSHHIEGHLTKAKELLERLLITSCNSDVLNLLPNCSEVLRVRVEAEQFLNEVEK